MQDKTADKEYADLVTRILCNGIQVSSRIGGGTRSIFGETISFDLTKEFPILNSKRVFFHGVKAELLWFIEGSTNTKKLSEQKVFIWDSTTSNENLKKLGFNNRSEGDLGPGYGFQWRHYGASYVDCNTDYTDKGIDQLSNVIHELKTNPRSRRIVMTSWNPKDVPLMTLPPCHHTVQFLADDDKNLTCVMMQRSCDICCGLPFNIASYALLTHMVASVTDLIPYKLVIQIGDAHIYNDHVGTVKEQIIREPRKGPQLKLNKKEKITDYEMKDIILESYDPHPSMYYQLFV